MDLEFSTKAGTLAALQGKLQSALVAPLHYFTVADWQADSQAQLAAVTKALGQGPFIIRSSCQAEDSLQASNAGAFLSVQHVGIDGLAAAIEQVIASYPDQQGANEVLVQPQLQQVQLAGVAFSHDPNTCAPYRVINWTGGPDTTAVTGGADARIWQSAAGADSSLAPAELHPVLALLEELLRLFNEQPVDCEFALTGNTAQPELYLLQARPLLLKETPESVAQQSARLTRIADKISRGLQPHYQLKGKRTVYGVMPDWNPAEIIGIRPRPLALSLYRELVTDATWAYQRNNYGYRNLRSFPLMPDFFGLPYIDVRLSFNSFIPSDLDDSLAERLVDHYIDRLLQEPLLHDKVEFEILYSCYTLDLPERLSSLSEFGFSTAEQEALAASLRQLTNRILHQTKGLWRIDSIKINILNSRREALYNSRSDKLERIYWLLEDAKRYGTLPFAGLARAGFMAIQILKSLVSVGIFSQQDYDSFMASLSTVSGQLARDRAMLDRSTFLARYGHLRPGTYDILSPRYDEAPELYFDWSVTPPEPVEAAPFSLSIPQMREINQLLQSHGLETDVVALFDFLQSAIEQREWAKFQFTRNLSDALALIASYGEGLGFAPEDLSFCNIQTLQNLHTSAQDPVRELGLAIERGRESYLHTQHTALPPVITRPEDVWGFLWPDTEPNFITQQRVTGDVKDSHSLAGLAGAIVCIPNADPGFDWLFSHRIGGLITAWGGSNSHMAIRAGELGLPAVIGCGEQLYQRWSSARRLHLDCATRRVEILM